MRIIAPVTDYIKGSLLTTIGDLVSGDPVDHDRIVAGVLDTYLKAQGAGVKPVYEKLTLSDTGIFMAHSARSISGAQPITGVGFESSIVIFLASDATEARTNWSIGADDGVTFHRCLARKNAGAAVGLMHTHSLRIDRVGANSIYGYISVKSADGFVITWTLVGVAAVDFIYVCLP